jgi:histone acetyltransferase (RNA polymerase elongator complex component)
MTVLPFFLPNLGCPGRCVFCDQGLSAAPSPLPPTQAGRWFQDTIEGLSPAQREAGVELAFFGGSFTGLPRPTLEDLLAQAQDLLARGQAQALRISTHPGLLGPGLLELLARRGVTTVELGIQSTDEAVLAASGRGHGRREALEACKAVQDAGLRLGVQLMPGLPGASAASDLQSARDLAALRPQDFRLYPCLVLRGTPLAASLASGRFRPLTLEEAVDRCAQALDLFLAVGARPLRLGLLDQPGLAEAVLAGPAHPALGELVWAQHLATQLAGPVREASSAGPLRLLLQRQVASLLLGHRRRGLARLTQLVGWGPEVEVLDFPTPEPHCPGHFTLSGGFGGRREGSQVWLGRQRPLGLGENP